MSLNLIGKKKGMIQIFDENGDLVVCSVLQVEPNVVVQIKSRERDGYQSLQLGGIKILNSKKKNVTKPLVGHFAKAKVELHRHLVESKVEGLEECQVGGEFDLNYFSDSQFVDVIGKSKGKGFQGVIKRHNFAGGPGAHGSKFHRSAGSTGMRSTPGRCFPGKRMAGRMGMKRTVSMNLKIIKIDAKKHVMLVKGAVPGAKNSLVYVRKSIKKNHAQNG